MKPSLPSVIDTDWYEPYRHSGKCPLKTIPLMLGYGIVASGIAGVAGYYGGAIPVFLGKLIFGIGAIIGNMKGGATGKIGYAYLIPVLIIVGLGLLFPLILGVISGSFIGSVGKTGKCRNAWLAGAIAGLCGIATYGIFAWMTMKFGGGLHETSHLTKLIDLPSDSVWMFLIMGVDALVVIGSSMSIAVESISKTPFCEKCNEWYLDPIKGRYPAEIATGLFETLETSDPRNLPTYQSMSPNANDTYITVELQKCACQQSDYRLITSLHWQEAKQKKDGKAKVEDKIWFATMISQSLGRQLRARLFPMSGQPANPDTPATAPLPTPMSEPVLTKPSTDTIPVTNNKCPICDKEINADARLCNYCGATFEISMQGYCVTCHQVLDADANNCCQRCGTSLVDIHTKSEYIIPDSLTSQALIQGNVPTSQSVQSNKRSSISPLVRILGISLILVTICFITIKFMQPAFTVFLATETPRPTRTHTPTSTLAPTPTQTPKPTSTPLPVEVTFDTIGNYPTGHLVILVGRLALMSTTRCSLSECGLLLENPARPSQTMTIFVPVGLKPNQMKPLIDQYTKSDIQVQLNDGTFAVVGYRIRVTGRVCSTTNKESCISDIIKIELFQVKQ